MKLEKKHEQTARAFLQCRVASVCLNKVCKLNTGISVDVLHLQVNALTRTSNAKCEFSRAIWCRLPFDLVGIRNHSRAESPDVPCKCLRAAARDPADQSVASDGWRRVAWPRLRCNGTRGSHGAPHSSTDVRVLYPVVSSSSLQPSGHTWRHGGQHVALMHY